MKSIVDRRAELSVAYLFVRMPNLIEFNKIPLNDAPGQIPTIQLEPDLVFWTQWNSPSHFFRIRFTSASILFILTNSPHKLRIKAA